MSSSGAVRCRKTVSLSVQIENLQEQLKDKEKQMTSLKERVKSLQADTSNTDTALTTLEEALAEKVDTHQHTHIHLQTPKSVNVGLYPVRFRVVVIPTFSLP